jgi:hypothetical protein
MDSVLLGLQDSDRLICELSLGLRIPTLLAHIWNLDFC